MSKKKTPSKKLTITQDQELEVLRSVVEITNSDFDLQYTLDEIVKTVTKMTEADSVFIYLFDSTHKHLILMASKIPHKKELGNVNLKVGEGITGWVAKENKPVAISENAYKDKRFKSFDVLPEDKYEAFLSMPIIHNKKPIGVINVQHRKSHEYDRKSMDVLELIAKQVSGVLENARLYDETKKKAVQFDSLNKVSQSIISESYLDEILNLIVVVTAEMLNSKICSIMLLDPKGKELVMKATQSLSMAYKKKPNLSVQGSLSGEVITKKKPIVIYDVQKEEKYKHRELAVQESLTSMLAVPMIVKDHAVGVVSVYTKDPREFSEEEINVLQMVANQAAVSVENTKLMDETVKAKEALETRKIIERAKGILMKMQNLSEDAAYRLIHKKSMDSGKTMKEIAESLLLIEEFKNT